MKKRERRRHFKEGAIVRIPLGPRSHTYGQLLVHPWVRVFDALTTEDGGVNGITSRPVLFTAAVHTYGIEDGRWPIVDELSLSPEQRRIPETFVQDVFEPSSLWVLSSTPDGSSSQRPSTVAECEGLESASVWDPVHVEERIRDHYAGRVNLHLLSMRLVRPGDVFTILLDRGVDSAGNWVVSGRAHSRVRVGDSVLVGRTHLQVTEVTDYLDQSSISTVVAGRSASLHLMGDLVDELRTERVVRSQSTP